MMNRSLPKFLSFAGMSLLASIPLAQAQALIDVSFPDGTGTNPLFLEIDNGIGNDNVWTQGSGVLASSLVVNSTIGVASDALIDFTALGSDLLTVNVDVASVSGEMTANGMFIGFQRRTNGGSGADLWNNLATSFGLVIPGAAGVLNGTRNVGIGGNGENNRYQAVTYGIATVASIQDGFSVTLEVSSVGWEVVITGLEDADAAAITGGSGTWGVDGTSAWAEFTSDMRVGTSYQTAAAGGDLALSSVNLIQSESSGPPLQISSIEVAQDPANPGATLTWASVPSVNYSVDFSTNLVDWFEITDSASSLGSSITFVHEFSPNFLQLVGEPQLFYRIRLE